MIRIRSLLTGVPGSPYYSNFFFGGGDSTEAQAASDVVQAFWVTVGQLMVPALKIQVESFVPSINPQTGDVVGGFTTTPQPVVGGSGSGTSVPPSSQMLASLLTGAYLAGRQIRGKFNLPCVTEEHNVGDGVPSGNGLDLLRTGFNTMIAAGPELQVWSRKNGVTAPVSSVSMSPKWAVLRSRRD